MKAALYARVSTSMKYERQDPATQLLPLREFCERRGWEVYSEYIDDVSAVKRRPEYDRMLANANAGRFDVILTVKLDRIFRSVKEFVYVVGRLDQWRVRFVCIDQGIDTDQDDPTGRLQMHILAAVAEFERALISERVKAGIHRARIQGKPWGGRQRKIIDLRQVKQLQKSGLSLSKISLIVGCNRNLLSRTLRKR